MEWLVMIDGNDDEILDFRTGEMVHVSGGKTPSTCIMSSFDSAIRCGKAFSKKTGLAFFKPSLRTPEERNIRVVHRSEFSIRQNKPFEHEDNTLRDWKPGRAPSDIAKGIARFYGITNPLIRASEDEEIKAVCGREQIENKQEMLINPDSLWIGHEDGTRLCILGVKTTSSVSTGWSEAYPFDATDNVNCTCGLTFRCGNSGGWVEPDFIRGHKIHACPKSSLWNEFKVFDTPEKSKEFVDRAALFQSFMPTQFDVGIWHAAKCIGEAEMLRGGCCGKARQERVAI